MIPSSQGFILTRHCSNFNGKNIIHYWLATDAGPVKLSVENEPSLFFVEAQKQEIVEKYLSDHQIKFESKPIDLQNFSYQKMIVIYFPCGSIFYQAKNLLNTYEIEIYESSVREADRYLMERFICAGVEFRGQRIERSNFTEYQQPQMKGCDFHPQLRLLSLDVECSSKGELYSIGLFNGDRSNGMKKVIMVDPLAHQREMNQSEEWIEWVVDEKNLLLKLQQCIQLYDPDIIIGWNIINFDFKLMIQRAKKNNLILKLGRSEKEIVWRENVNDSQQGFVSLEGRMVIDGISSLKAESYNLDSFSLENVSQKYLGEGKKTQNVDDRLQEIIDDFHHNKPKLAEYNIQDCILVWKIFEKLQLMDFLIFRSQLTGLELDRSGGSVAAFNHLYLPRLHRQGYISPNLPKNAVASPGGFVMDSKPGLYKNVLILDFKSLYPSIIRTFKIDPLGLIVGLHEQVQHINQPIPGYRGAFFSREKHILPELITQLWQQRDIAKKDKDLARSQAIKILMNSFYGVLGSSGCAFYDTRLASSITLRGHFIMQQTAKWIEAQGYEVIYGDTDSTFVLLKPQLLLDQCIEIGKDLEQSINEQWKNYLETEFNLPCYLEIEFETTFCRFLMPTIRGSKMGSKKRYAGLVKTENQETLLFKGLENVRSDWTILAKTFQHQLYQMIFHDQNPSDYIRETVQQIYSGQWDEQLVYRKRLRKKLNSYVKNTPPQVKAAKIADEHNRSLGRSPKYQNKGWISYVFTQSGPQPVDHVTAESVDDAIKEADRLLYVAKSRGKHCVIYEEVQQ